MEDLSVYHGSDLLHNQEQMSKYRPGGFHPVRLGDTFKGGRYKVHHKLGWGGFSTVWLAKDKKREQWVSIKIITADNSKQSRELRNFLSLAGHRQGHLHSKYIVQLLDDFFHQGPNGTHHCLVFELLGPTVDAVVREIHEGGDVLDPDIILRMSKQLLQAIAFMHEVGYTHGDLSGMNVAFTCNALAHLTDEEFFKVLGAPESEELARLDGKPLDEGLPNQLVKAADWIRWTDETVEDLRIFDLGEAFLKGDKPKMLAQPSQLKAPETIFTDSYDHRLDLWRAGIMIYTFLFGARPFQCFGLDFLVEGMIDFVEGLPTEWQQKWDDIRLNSGHDYSIGNGKGKGKLPRSRLEQNFDDWIHEETLKPLLPVIQGLMRFRSSDRISISQALDMIRSISGSASTDEETGDGMDEAEDGMDAGIVRPREEGPDELPKLRPASHLYSHL